MKTLILLTALMLVTGCVMRTYEVNIICMEGSTVTFKAEVLAEVPHETNIDGKLDLPDANLLGK